MSLHSLTVKIPLQVDTHGIEKRDRVAGVWVSVMGMATLKSKPCSSPHGIATEGAPHLLGERVLQDPVDRLDKRGLLSAHAQHLQSVDVTLRGRAAPEV